MICKKCGFEPLTKDGDWLVCPKCGAKFFDTSINISTNADKKISATEQIEEIEKEKEIAETPKSKKNKKGKKDKKAKEEKPQSKAKEIIDFFLPIVIAVVIALLLKSFVFANTIVPTGSMINTIQEKDRIISSRLAYISKDPERYDIIIFNFPDDESQYYVKRVIGLPGETLQVINGVAYVTDKDGNKIQTETSFITNCVPTGDYGPYYIPEKGEVITTDGTNCYAENSSIVGGTNFIEKYCTKQEDGTYIVSENCYFCMGDNRNTSYDARYWTNTYVSKNKIIGKVMFRYYPSIGKVQ